MNATPEDVTLLLRRLREGDQGAAAELIPLIYNELHRLARRQMHDERRNHTLQPTALVNEAYLKLVQHHPLQWQNRTHFFAVAAQTMRHILIDHARNHLRQKRGGGQEIVAISENFAFSPEQSEGLLSLDQAMVRLSALDERQCRIVELRFFAGLSVEETAAVLNISPKTVKRDWSVAKAWLHGELRGDNAAR